MLRTIDAHFLDVTPRPELSGLRRGLASLLVIMTFTIVANLKHIKARVHVPAP